MNYNQEINNAIEAKKGKDISLKTSSEFNTPFGSDVQFVFKVDDVEILYVFPTAMVLSLFEIHVKNGSHK